MRPARQIKPDIFAVLLVTAFLLTYCVLLRFDSTFHIALIMFLLSPFMVIWMVITVLREGKYEGPDLGDEEFGYQDKKKEDLGVF